MKLLRHRVPMPLVLVLLSTLLACALATDTPSRSDAGRSSSSESTAATATNEPACRLRVVDRTGAAVPGAEVTLVDDATTEHGAATSPATRHSDRDGFVDLRGLPAAWLRATARSGSLYGTTRFATDDWTRPHVELRVDTDLDVRCRIVDDRGEPQADLRVVVEALTLPPDEEGCWREVAARESNDDGLVVVPHAQTFGCWPIDGRRRLRARVDLLGVDPPAIEFALKELGPEPVVLACPANGRIVVRTLRPTGQHSPMPARLPLEARVDGGSYERAVPIERRRPDLVLAAPLARGWHLRTERHAWVDFRGPTTAGEAVTVDLVEKATTWFTLSLHDSDGRPLAGHRLVGRWDEGDGWIDEASDAEGRLRQPWLVPGEVARTYRVLDAEDQAIGSVQVRLPTGDATPASEVDLGPIPVQPFPSWLNGVVLDAVTQQPLAATVTCLADLRDLPAVRTDAQGRFTVHAPPRADLMLFAHAPDHARSKVLEIAARAEPPRKELQILLHPAQTGAVRLEVLHDPEVCPVDWTVNGGRTQPASILWPRPSHAGPEVGDYELEAREPGRTTFLARRVPVGRRNLELRSFPGGPPLAVVRDLEVAANRLTEDPRLVLDLRGKVADARCRIELPRDENATGMALLRAREGGTWAEIPFDGELRATLPNDAAVPMLVVSDHGLPIRTDLRSGASRIAVPPLPQCRVQVRGLPDDAPEGRLRLVPFLLARNEPVLAELRGHFGWMMSVADERNPLASLRSPAAERAADACNRMPLTNGTATTTLQWRGRYAFLLQVRDDAGAWNSLYERTPEHVDITTGGEQTIELTVDPEQVRALLRPQRPANGK
ncbi:MAG: carboxypeptidase regulatory-like domain-containing protein [Planctomycetes bacterium]|nr:carboxypeptidase regulatory-like domain-containing protein [Planctomycetota bacterium]